MSIRYKYARLLNEGYNFTNADEVYSALKSNQIGVKTQPEYKEKIKWDYTCEKLKIFFKKCESLNIKDTTYGVQLLLSKVPPNNLENIIREDGLYELLKSRKKPWVKELKEYQTLMNEKVWLGAAVSDLHVFEKAVQNEQSNHGKTAKGGGQLKDVKVPYDDGTWKLMIPTSFEGEKAAAFYIKDGEETPTEWCTRVNKSYYRRYTEEAPLYIIRNMKTGKSYQMAFESGHGWDDEEYVTVHFLDQNDVKGDEITQGDLSKIPNELLKHIPIPVGKAKGKTMADYNTDKFAPDPMAGKKGYINKSQETWSEEQPVDKKVIRTILDRYKSFSPKIAEFFSKQPIVKIVSIKGSYHEGAGRDKLSKYVEQNVRAKEEYFKKARKIRYYEKGHPDKYVEFIASKSANIPPSMNNSTATSRNSDFLRYVGFCDMGFKIPSKELSITRYGISDRYEDASKSQIKAAKEYRPIAEKERHFEKEMVLYVSKKLKKIGYTGEAELSSFGDRVQPKHISTLKKKLNDSSYSWAYYIGHAPGKKWSMRLFKGEEYLGRLYIEFNGIPLKREGMKVSIESNSNFTISEKLRNVCYEASLHIFNTWRKQFHNEIIQNRGEGNYINNMYEDIDIKNKFRKLITG